MAIKAGQINIHEPIGALKPTLIFPAGMPRSLDYLEKCRREGQPVIGSSSLPYDVCKPLYPAWAYLPYITDSTFRDALTKTIREHGLGMIYSPNPVVWNYLQRALKDIDSEVTLVNGSPVESELGDYRAALQHANKALNFPLSIASSHPLKAPVSELEIAILFKHGHVISGMCDDEKIAALCEIARHSPEGDLVEIGSWWGKSAFILAKLAQYYAIGNLLCVDPWKSEHLVQHDKGGLVDGGISQYDCEEALKVFIMNLLPYSRGDINYLRMPSTAAAATYKSGETVHSAAFGTTHYTGEIAILHIDGNHSEDAVRADMESWCERVKAGGWIIVDDYLWPYGDGPRHIADEYLEANHCRLSSAFVMGTALFMQISLEQSDAV